MQRPYEYGESDMSNQLTAEGFGNGSAGGMTLADQLTFDGPPVVVQTLAESSPVPGPVAVSTTAAPAAAPASVAATPAATAGFLGRTWAGAVNAVSPAYNSLAASGQTAIKSLGVQDGTAAKIGAWVPWLLLGVVVTICGTVYALRRRIFSHHITA